MNLKLNLLQSFLLFGAMQGIFLAFVLFFYRRKSNSIVNRNITSILLLLISYNLIYATLFTSGQIKKLPFLLRTTDNLQFLLVVLTYFFIRSHVEKGKFDKKFFLISLIPYLLSTIYLLPIWFSSSAEKLLFYKEFMNRNVPIDFKILYFLKILFAFIFLGLSLKILKKHVKKTKMIFSNLEDVNLNWLRNIVFIYLFIFSVALLRPFFDFGPQSIYLLGFAVIFLIFYLSIHNITQKEIYREISYETLKIAEIILDDNKYKSSTISLDEAETIYQKLNSFIIEDKTYLDKNCTLQCLSQKIEIPSASISQVLNQFYETNFYEFINKFKIEAAKNMLLDENFKNLTIDAIAKECGFKSKSTFYNSFKKATGLTPSKFQKTNSSD